MIADTHWQIIDTHPYRAMASGKRAAGKSRSKLGNDVIESVQAHGMKCSYNMQKDKTKCGLSTEVHSVGGHKTHAMVAPSFGGEMTHYGPLVLFWVVDNHVSKPLLSSMASCSASVIIIRYVMMVH